MDRMGLSDRPGTGLPPTPAPEEEWGSGREPKRRSVPLGQSVLQP